MAEPFLTIVIPAYNEARRIGPTLQRVQAYIQSKSFPVELIVVDDGSTDSTPELLRQAAKESPPLQVLRNEPNRGKGFSVRRGVLASKGQYVLFTDADLSSPIEETDKLLAALQSADAAAAIGSRALNRKLIGIPQPWFRDFGGRCFNLVVRLLTGLKLRDTQCGLKLFRRASTIEAFKLQRVQGFGFDPELLFLIERKKGKIVEVPVRWNNDPDTKVHFLSDASKMVIALITLRFRALVGKYAD